jgi:hypothetical protein
MLNGRKKTTAMKIYIKIDLTKAYDNVSRKSLIAILEKRAQTDFERQAINLTKAWITVRRFWLVITLTSLSTQLNVPNKVACYHHYCSMST